MSNKNMAAALSEAVTSEMQGKKFYKSKTFWANVVMAAAVAVQSKYGFVMGPEMQALAISGINLLLRKITKEAVVW